MPDPVIEERHLCRLLALAAIFISGIAGLANLHWFQTLLALSFIECIPSVLQLTHLFWRQNSVVSNSFSGPWYLVYCLVIRLYWIRLHNNALSWQLPLPFYWEAFFCETASVIILMRSVSCWESFSAASCQCSCSLAVSQSFHMMLMVSRAAIVTNKMNAWVPLIIRLSHSLSFSNSKVVLDLLPGMG